MFTFSDYSLRQQLNKLWKSPLVLLCPQFNNTLIKAESASKKVFQDFQVSIEEYVLELRVLCQYSESQIVYERIMTRTSDNKVVFEDLYFAGFEYSRPRNS
jgi:hypothetical protein